MQTISRQGVGFIAGYEACYLFSYKDSAGVWTDGLGNTAAAGIRAPQPGGRITLTQALEEFERNLQRYAAAVRRAITTELTQCEFDALVSFHFNTGAILSGSVDNKLNRGDRAAAIQTLKLYVNSRGKFLRGLQSRRNDEATIFLTGNYPIRPVLIKTHPGDSGRLVHPDDLPWGVKPTPAKLDLPKKLDLPPLPEKSSVRENGNFIISLFMMIRKLLGI